MRSCSCLPPWRSVYHSGIPPLVRPATDGKAKTPLFPALSRFDHGVFPVADKYRDAAPAHFLVPVPWVEANMARHSGVAGLGHYGHGIVGAVFLHAFECVGAGRALAAGHADSSCRQWLYAGDAGTSPVPVQRRRNGRTGQGDGSGSEPSRNSRDFSAAGGLRPGLGADGTLED